MTRPEYRSFAVIPAAGTSSRMGKPKLLLPFGGRRIIEHVLDAWQPEVSRAVVVVRDDDQRLIACCEQFDVDLVKLPVPTPDMKATVIAALDHLENCYGPAKRDCWLLAPADMPTLSRVIIKRVREVYDPDQPRIVVAANEDRMGHPVLLPWSLATAVRELGPTQGIRDLLRERDPVVVECGDPGVLSDIDTPDDYRDLLG